MVLSGLFFDKFTKAYPSGKLKSNTGGFYYVSTCYGSLLPLKATKRKALGFRFQCFFIAKLTEDTTRMR